MMGLTITYVTPWRPVPGQPRAGSKDSTKDITECAQTFPSRSSKIDFCLQVKSRVGDLVSNSRFVDDPCQRPQVWDSGAPGQPVWHPQQHGRVRMFACSSVGAVGAMCGCPLPCEHSSDLLPVKRGGCVM